MDSDTFRGKLRLQRNKISWAALAIALTVASPANADNQVSSLQGHIAGAAKGTTVVVIDAVTSHKTTVTVDERGNYVVLGLRPSTYRVIVEGHAEQEANVPVGQAVVVDFDDTTSGTDIVVTGNRSQREVRNSIVSQNVTTAQIENLPQNARNFLSYAILAPGVQITSPSGAAQIQSGAVSSSNTNVFIDNISFKNLTNHGGQFGQNFGQGGNPFPQIAIQEYQIQTQNFGAETGQAATLTINAVTKTGGNAFHGSAFIDFQPKAFIGRQFLATGPKPEYNRYQFGGEIGGPIIKDKLTFYFAGEGTSESLPGSVGSLPQQTGSLAFPSSVASQIVGVPRNFNFNQGLYFGKLTYYATDHDTINVETFVRREKNLADIDQNAAATHARDLNTSETRYQLNWRHTAGDLSNDFNVTYDTSTQGTPTVGTSPEFNVTGVVTDPVTGVVNRDNFNPGSGAELGAHFFTQTDRQKTLTFKNDLTVIRGLHKIKLGGQVIFADLARNVTNADNGRYYFNNPGPAVANFDPLTAIPYGADINIQNSPELKSKDTFIGFYAQDEWKPNDHWTFNYGLRWDFETNSNNNNYVTPANIVNALRNYPNLAAAGININDYISTGKNRKPEYGAIQPRFGLSYDVKGDRDLVLFAGAGRYFDRSLFIEGAIETLANSGNIQRICFTTPTNPTCPVGRQLAFNPSLLDPNNLRAAVQAVSPTNGGGDVFLLNNKTPLPFTDQVDFGVRKRFGKIQTSVTFAYQRSHNIFQFIRGNRYPDGSYSSVGLGVIQDNFPDSGRLPNFTGRLDLGASAGQAELFALYLQAEKPFTDKSQWGFTSSFTLQSARTNDAAPSLNDDEVFNGGSQTAYGSGFVAGVPKWIWNTSVNYRAPLGITLSGLLQLNSGPTFGSVIFGTDRNGRPLPPGTIYANFLGINSPKPLIGFKQLDLRVAKTFKLPFGTEVTGYFEALNVFNWLNRNYSAWNAGAGLNPPLVSDNDGQVANSQRQFQAGLKIKF
jgi:outer membrane receptor protein involved in Fe transport